LCLLIAVPDYSGSGGLDAGAGLYLAPFVFSRRDIIKAYAITSRIKRSQRQNIFPHPHRQKTEKFLYQKMEYIHANPVRKNYVAQADHWYWSSANHNCELVADNIWGS
jgi:hypothetical protein